MESLQACLRRAAVQTRKGVQFFDRQGRVTRYPYNRIYNDAIRMAWQLRALGIQSGSHVALIQSTSPEMIRSLFAVYLAGGVPCCLPSPRMGRLPDYAGTIASMLKGAQIKHVITEQKIKKQIDAAAVIAKAVVLCVEEFPEHEFLGVVSGPAIEGSDAGNSEIPEAPEPIDIADPADRDLHSGQSRDLALIQYSSGTTQAPKPVGLTQHNIISNTSAILQTFPGDLNDHSGVSWLPLHHDMGLIGGLFTAVVGQGDITLLRPEDFVARPANWLQALSVSRATISPAPNFAMQLCASRVSDDIIASLDLSHWQIALIGAEMVRESTLQLFYNRFKPAGFRYESFTPVYGLAEATLAVTFSAIDSVPTAHSFDVEQLSLGIARVVDADQSSGIATINLTSVGKPLDGVQVEIRSVNGNVLSEGHTGHIFVRGPSVMRGYLNADGSVRSTLEAEGTGRAALDPDGWLDTADLGFMHAGEVYIYGRARDILIINGRNIDPHMIESVLVQLHGLQEDGIAAVADASDRDGSEGFIVLAEKQRAPNGNIAGLAHEARAAIIRDTGLIPSAVYIVETGKLPRTTSGKIKRGEAKQLLQSGAFELLASA